MTIALLLLAACAEPLPLEGDYFFRFYANLDQGDCSYDDTWFATDVNAEVRVTVTDGAFTMAAEEDDRFGEGVTCDLDGDLSFDCALLDDSFRSAIDPDYEGDAEDLPPDQTILRTDHNQLEGTWRRPERLSGTLYIDRNCEGQPGQCEQHGSRYSDSGDFSYPCNLEKPFVADHVP